VLNGANTVEIFTGKGDGTFNSGVSFAVGTGPVALGVGDFNGDKKMDLAVANYTASSVTVLLNTSSVSTLSFSQASGSPYATGSNPTSIAVADFNGDKHLDLAVGSFTGENVTMLLGSATGSFTEGTALFVGQPLLSVAAADFDGDGKIDLVTGTNGPVFVFLGNGNGTFNTTEFGVPNNTSAVALLAVDINGDKKMDLLTVERDKFDSSATFTVNINSSTVGNPRFVFPGVHYSPGYQPSAIGLADFNHDGKVDANL
jgi:FG-GAP-like repeat